MIYGERSGVHVSGHAAQEDLRMMLNLAAPAVLRPGARRVPHQHLHAELARQSGIPDEDIFILENGDVLELDADNAEIVDKVPTGMVFVDGFEIGDAEGLVLRDRQQLAGDGILIAVVTVDAPERRHRGAAGARRPRLPPRRRAPQGRARRVRARPWTSSWTSSAPSTSPASSLIREDINQRLAELVFRRTKRRPLIMPVVVEV